MSYVPGIISSFLGHASQNVAILGSVLASLTDPIAKTIRCSQKLCVDQVLGEKFLHTPNKMDNVRRLLLSLSAMKEAQGIKESLLQLTHELINDEDRLLIEIAKNAHMIVTSHFKELANTAFEKAKRQALKPHLSPPEQRYLEMTRRLSIKELHELNQKLKELPEKEKNITALMDAITKGEYKAAILSSPELPFYALDALHLGLIDEYQFGTIQTVWAIKEQHGSFNSMRVISLFNEDESINKEAYEIIHETLTNIGPNDKKVTFLKEEKLAELFLAFKQLPKSERVFFALPNQELGPNHICDALNHVKFNIFCRAPKRGVRMHPSLGMMQALIKVKHGDQGVKINPVLGLSPAVDMKKIEERDLAVHFPGVKLPKTADGFNAPTMIILIMISFILCRSQQFPFRIANGSLDSQI